MFKRVFGQLLYRQIICKMLVLLLTFAVLLGVGCGQSNDTPCPTLKEVHSSQEALASQLRAVLAKYNQQQSSESLMNLMQLMLVKQLMAEMDLNTSPAAGEGTTSGNRSECKPTNATIAGSDLTGVVEAMNATINRLVVKDMENRQAIYNLTTIVKESRQVTHTLATAIQDNRHAISNLTTVLQQLQTTRNLSAAIQDNRHAIRNLTTLVKVKGEIQATHNLSQTVWNNEKWLHNLTSSVQENRQAIHNLTQVVRDFKVYGSIGWRRVAHLNMTDPSEQCPSGFRLYSESGVRACGRPTLARGCPVSVRFPTHGVPFSEVCGRVTGYQYYAPDAIDGSISNQYVDGVSLTYGSPHKHIWSFAAANQESSTSCPCSRGAQSANSFIGNEYFCESGNSGPSIQRRLYPEPLWDGQGCRSRETPCCNATGIPWFHKRLSTVTTDFIELSLCSDHTDEDTPVGYYDIFVK